MRSIIIHAAIEVESSFRSKRESDEVMTGKEVEAALKEVTG